MTTASTTIPTTPIDDGAELVTLKLLNPVPEFDNAVRMDRASHIYYENGVALDRSLTGVMQEYLGEFDTMAKATEIYARCRAAERDPTPLYPRPAWLVDQIARYRGFDSAQAIAESWDNAREKGTALHRLIERFENTAPLLHAGVQCIEFRHYLAFRRDIIQANGLAQFRTEFSMALFGIGGQADALYLAPDGTLWLVDWKCKLDLWSPAKPKKAAAPFDSMPLCDATKFTIQANGYRAMLQAKTRFRVSRMLIVLLHAQNPTYVVHEVPVIDDMIAALFDIARKRLITRRCCEARDQLARYGTHEDELVARYARQRAIALLQECETLDALAGDGTVDLTGDE